MELLVENNLYREGYALGSRERYFLEPGLRKVTGSLRLGIEDMGYLRKYLELDNTSLRINVKAQKGCSLEIFLPRVVFSGEIKTVFGKEQDVQQVIPFVALKDDGLGTDIRVTLINNQQQV
jgi:hypothetical protein